MFRLSAKLDNIRRNVRPWKKKHFGDIFKTKKEVELDVLLEGEKEELVEAAGKILELSESTRVMEEGEIVDIDDGDPLPFLQGIEDLLRTPLRNMVIEEVCESLNKQVSV